MRIPDPQGVALDAATASASPRPVRLDGRRLAVLDNGKPNAPYVVRRLAEQLARRFQMEPPEMVGKALSSRPAPEEVLTGFRGFDAALVGVGD